MLAKYLIPFVIHGIAYDFWTDGDAQTVSAMDLFQMT